MSTFVDEDLRGARFVRSLLSDAVMRGVAVDGMEIDSPWLDEAGSLVVNGVDVAPLVDAALDRRFPGRSLRWASDPAGLREAWAAVERTWAATLARVDAMPDGAVDVSVDDEWTFAQTLRHLVMATDVWLRGTILRDRHPYHRFGVPFAEYESDGYDMSVFSAEIPPYEEVLAVRASRVAMVREFLETVTDDLLVEQRPHPWSHGHATVSVLACVQTILHEEWEHHRYAVRDLDAQEQEARRG